MMTLSPATTVPSFSTPTIDVDVGTVHVWSLPLDAPSSRIAALWRLLSSTEQARAARLRIDRARDQFVVRRGMLRVILGHYLGRRPVELDFQYGPYGKPELAPSANDRSLTFNLSDSYGIALYAVTRDCTLGVDVEQVREHRRHVELADRYFAVAEREELHRLPARARRRAFYNGWTRKEAYVKAIGTGLVTRLDSFAVTLAPGSPARLLTHAPAIRGQWTLASLDTIPGWAAALVVAGDCERIVHRPWAEHGQGSANGSI